ncbi:hypothetical protein M0J18_RS09820 [Morganella morganii]|nr:hypothetical protein [Morganella morganii]
MTSVFSILTVTVFPQMQKKDAIIFTAPPFCIFRWRNIIWGFYFIPAKAATKIPPVPAGGWENPHLPVVTLISWHNRHWPIFIRK